MALRKIQRKEEEEKEEERKGEEGKKEEEEGEEDKDGGYRERQRLSRMRNDGGSGQR